MAKFNAGVIDRCQIAAGVNETGGKFVTGTGGVVDTGGKICHQCQRHRWRIATDGEFATGVNDTGGK